MGKCVVCVFRLHMYTMYCTIHVHVNVDVGVYDMCYSTC